MHDWNVSLPVDDGSRGTEEIDTQSAIADTFVSLKALDELEGAAKKSGFALARVTTRHVTLSSNSFFFAVAFVDSHFA
jgi:hypothetical protein